MIGLIVKGVGQISKSVNHSKTKKYAKDDDEIVDEFGLLGGWLSKSGDADNSNKVTHGFTWKPRFFRQTPDRMFLAYYTDTDTSKKPKGVIDLRLLRSVNVCAREDDRFYIEVDVWEEKGTVPDTSYYYAEGHMYRQSGTRKYEIRAPSAALAQKWIAEIKKRCEPRRIYIRGPEEHRLYIEWISNTEGNAGKPIPEPLHQMSLRSQQNYQYDFHTYVNEFGMWGPQGPQGKRREAIVYYRDLAGCVFDSTGRYYPNSTFYIRYGVMAPPGLDPEWEDFFQYRPYPRSIYEETYSPLFNSDEGKWCIAPDDYLEMTPEAWFELNRWPRDRALRKAAKIQAGVALDPEDLTPPPTPPRDDDSDGGGYGGYGDDDGPSSSYGYDDSSSTIEPETAYVAPQGMSPEERRQKELQHKLDQWERQCRQIEAANQKMKDTFDRQMSDYEKKHREWEKTTNEKCGTCKGSAKKDCTQCKGSGRGTGGKECLTCRGKAKFDCISCQSHKGLAYGPKGKYSEPKPPSKPNLKDLPRKPT